MNVSSIPASAFFLGQAPVSFSSVTVGTNSALHFDIAAPPGSYVLQASTNLKDWEAVSTNLYLLGPFNVADPAISNFTGRYYRMLQE